MVRTASSGGSSRRSGHRRIADILMDDDDSSDESAYHGYSYGYGSSSGGMLPVFLSDQRDLVEVMLELDEDSMVVRSVTPTSAAVATTAAASVGRHSSASSGWSSSTASRIRRKFGWLLTPAPTPPRTLADMMAVEDSPSGPLPHPAPAAMSSRDARRIRARLERSRSGAQPALKGLRFISQTTAGAADASELWRRVEARFATLAKDGLLSRDDFGECIGPFLSHAILACYRFPNLDRMTYR